MAFCTNCGAELGVGRFCTNCGARVGSSASAADVATRTSPPPLPFPPASSAPLQTSHRGRRAAVAPWLVVLLATVLVASAVVGVWLATRGSDDPVGPTSDGRTTSAPAEPATPGSSAPSPDRTLDASTTATVTGPPPIPPGVDLNGNRVAYPAANLTDDDPESAYRLPGDATGAVVNFELAGVTTISQVGLINGYTKVDSSGASTVDWYPLNRRVVRVQWGFDNGTYVEQTFDPDVRELQLVEVEEVETRTVELTILEVTPPGTGPGARDVTAISDVLLVGS